MQPTPELEGLLHDFEQALLSLDRLTARRILTAPGGPWTPIQLVEMLVVPALERIGAGWEAGVVALSQVYMSGRICEELVDELLPPASPQRKTSPKMAIAVLEDYHMLGKRIVYAILRASGFELQDYHRLGADELVGRVLEDDIELLLISTLMLPAALRVRHVSDRLTATGAHVKILVGGAPFRFDEQLWRQVGADAMARTASESVGIIARLVGDES